VQVVISRPNLKVHLVEIHPRVGEVLYRDEKRGWATKVKRGTVQLFSLGEVKEKRGQPMAGL